MLRSDLLSLMKVRQRFQRTIAMLLISLFSCVLFSGCGNSADPKKTAANIVEDHPEEEFNWGMERLERAIREFRPSTSDGVSVTNRRIQHELFPPDDKKPNYTARVTITSETSFLHKKLDKKPKEELKENQKQTNDLLDPLAPPQDDLLDELDLAGIGPRVPAATADIETRSVNNKTIFELEYLEGRWKLSQEPELKYEKLWFEYAFE